MKYDSSIPDSPKIPLDNYLGLLDDSTLVLGVKELLKSILREKYGSNKQICKSADINISTLGNYLYTNPVPIHFLKKLSQKELRQIYEKMTFVSARSRKITLPKFLCPKLAYVIGYLQGDGCIESNKTRINFTDEYLAQIKQIDKLFNELFGIKGTIFDRSIDNYGKSCYTIVFRNKVLNDFFRKVFVLPLGRKDYLRIPKIMLKDKTILKWYLRGLFDADGTLPKNPKTCVQYFIDLSLKNKEIILDVIKALKKYDIETLKPYLRKAKSPNSDLMCYTWELRIRRKNQIIRFLREIGFHHPDKRKRMKKLLSLEKDL